METLLLNQSSGGPRLCSHHSEQQTTILLHRNNEEALHFLQNYQPRKDGVTRLRFLLYGPVGNGKSSFINSVMNVMRGQMTNKALVCATNSTKSATKKVRKEQAGVSPASA